ncbi:TPA: hypothetical protein RK087_000290 [Enterobacter hormaechei subsp. xiangfangensis]|nr:hypothetical protein [Enterobacter hormaechei]HDW0968430.1 hypothetical protein [Enterobacter hormaechei subsp. xiangfangensis]
MTSNKYAALRATIARAKRHDCQKVVMRVTLAEEILDQLSNAEKRIAEMQALASGVKQFSEFQICHYGATEDYAKGYIDCQNNYNKVLFAEASKGEAL